MLKFNWKLQTFLFYAFPQHLCAILCALSGHFFAIHIHRPPPLQSRASLIGWGNRSSAAAAASGKVKRSRSSFKGVLFQSDWIVLAAHTQLTSESGKKQRSLDQLMFLFEVGVCELLPVRIRGIRTFQMKKVTSVSHFCGWVNPSVSKLKAA